MKILRQATGGGTQLVNRILLDFIYEFETFLTIDNNKKFNFSKWSILANKLSELKALLKFEERLRQKLISKNIGA